MKAAKNRTAKPDGAPRVHTLDATGTDYEQFRDEVNGAVQLVFPLFTSVAVVVIPAPGMPAVVLPTYGAVPGIIGDPDFEYTG
jgi:hypothetical protein